MFVIGTRIGIYCIARYYRQRFLISVEGRRLSGNEVTIDEPRQSREHCRTIKPGLWSRRPDVAGA